MPFYSRDRETQAGRREYQLLEEHLTGVAKLAAGFTEYFDSGEWGRAAGFWHDLGKYQLAFQQKLQGKAVRVEHSGLGAALATRKSKNKAPSPLAYVIAGHHAGLPNLSSSTAGQPQCLQNRVTANQNLLDQHLNIIPPEIIDITLPKPPGFLMMNQKDKNEDKDGLLRSREFWTRFLYSALIDADRLDSERYENPEKTEARSGFSSIEPLGGRLDQAIDDFVTGLPDKVKNTPVNRARADVLASCRRAATQAPGLFSLTVPTGGGKTLAAMSFALNHAQHYGLRRVIVVIPYTSIIEQNAAIYRKNLGPENVVEHHSNLDIDHLRRQLDDETTSRQEMATENWDAPVIVTTTVQFFDSLFSNRPSNCRKLHNIARSVIILDEVQSLPPGFLLPILDGLNELASHYGCSIVLSTATPPALENRENQKDFLTGVRPIIEQPALLARDLERVQYEWPDLSAEPLAFETLADHVSEEEQVLVVTHKRNDARELAKLVSSRLDDPVSVFHLSALNCPAHRTDILEKVRERLKAKLPCRLISTQLIEAGVDVDFPIVYRALAGLDSVVQAAGRCNREGLLPEKGRVVVFNAPTMPPKGAPLAGYEAAKVMLNNPGQTLDPSDPNLFLTFFRIMYMATSLDEEGIRGLRRSFQFADVGDKFHLIRDGNRQPVIVPYGDYENRLAAIRDNGLTKKGRQALQPYTVDIYEHEYRRLEQWGALGEILPGTGLVTLSPQYRHLYDPAFGLVVPEEAYPDPGSLITG